MSQQEAAVAAAEDTFEYPITIEDAGPATKKVTVEIPQDRINAKLEEQYKELRTAATLPGFRTGHAPRKLVERRFGADVKDQVRTSLIRESYQQAVEKNKLNVLGEPEFDDPKAVENLPENGGLKFSITIETQPEINLPELKDLKVKKPVITVTEDHVAQALQNLKEQQGTLVPAEDRGIQEKDYVTADVAVKFENETVGNQADAQIVVRPGVVGGIDVKDLPAQLAGAKVDETRTVKATAPENHPAEKIRGKEVEIEFKVKDIKFLEPAVIDDDFLEQLGFKDQTELNDALREQMVERINQDIQQAQHNQVRRYLLDNVKIELPAKLSDRQEQRVVQRRAMDLQMRGMPIDQIRANVDRLKAGAREAAVNELKLFFTLGKYAEQHEIEVDEAEVNGQIATMAMYQNRRPEKLKQDMMADGSLTNLYLQIRERKTLDKLLESAQIEEVEVKGTESADSVDPAAKDHVDEAQASDAT
ncbi:MAG: trigger factor [Tepidisphaeraceae bacterium]